MPRAIEFDGKGRLVLTDGLAMGPQPGQLSVASLQPGDVLVWYSRDGGRISAAIREFSGGPYSHVGIYLGHGESIDAGPDGVQRVPVAALMAQCSYGTVMRYPGLTATRQATVVAAACSFEGRGYAWADAITLPARRRNYWSRWGFPQHRSVASVIGGLLIAMRKRWPPSTAKTFCSRMVIEAYAAADIFPLEAVQECAITPLEFAADGNFSYEGWLAGAISSMKFALSPSPMSSTPEKIARVAPNAPLWIRLVLAPLAAL